MMASDISEQKDEKTTLKVVFGGIAAFGFSIGLMLYAHAYLSDQEKKIFHSSFVSPMKVSSLELKLEDEDMDGRFEIPFDLDITRQYTLTFDNEGNAYLR